MTDFVAYASRWRLALLVMIGVAFLVLGLWFIGSFGEVPTSLRFSAAFTVVIGWATIGSVALILPLTIKRLVIGGEQLRIGRGGIRSMPWSDQTIPWNEIVKVTTWRQGNQRSIVLHLGDRMKFPGEGVLGAFAGVNRILTGGDVAISMTATDRTFDEAVAAIRTYHSVSD